MVGKRVYFWRTVICAMGSPTFMFCCTVLTFVFCCTALDMVFAQSGKHTGCEFLSVVYFYGTVVGESVCFGRTVLCAMGSLTFLFRCTVVDVVFAKWGKPLVCEFLPMVYFYETKVGGRV